MVPPFLILPALAAPPDLVRAPDGRRPSDRKQGLSHGQKSSSLNEREREDTYDAQRERERGEAPRSTPKSARTSTRSSGPTVDTVSATLVGPLISTLPGTTSIASERSSATSMAL